MKYIFCNNDFYNFIKKSEEFHPVIFKKSLFYDCLVLIFSDEDFNKISNINTWNSSMGMYYWCDGSEYENSPSYISILDNKKICLYYSKFTILNDLYSLNDLYLNSLLENEWPQINNFEEIPVNELSGYLLNNTNFNNIWDYANKVWQSNSIQTICKIMVSNAKLNSMNIRYFIDIFFV